MSLKAAPMALCTTTALCLLQAQKWSSVVAASRVAPQGQSVSWPPTEVSGRPRKMRMPVRMVLAAMGCLEGSVRSQGVPSQPSPSAPVFCERCCARRWESVAMDAM